MNIQLSEMLIISFAKLKLYQLYHILDLNKVTKKKTFAISEIFRKIKTQKVCYKPLRSYVMGDTNDLQ